MNHKNLRVVTNNLNVATLLTAKEDFRLIWPAAKCAPDGGIMGEATLTLSSIRASITAFSASAASIWTARCSNSTITKCAPNARLSKIPCCVMLVTDHSKFGRNAMVNLGNMNLIDYLFTDQLPPPSVMKIIEQYDVQLELC